MRIFAEAAAESLTKYGEDLCGDRVEILRDAEGTLVVLADGLGSGVRANLLAGLTSQIVATMIGGGADIRETVETVAGTLPVCRERGTAYSTFTILRVSQDGHASLVEFGNPEAVILRRGKRLELQKREADRDGKKILISDFETKPDDLIVLFSDGAVHAGKTLELGWRRERIVEYLEASCRPDDSARAAVRRLLAACDSLYLQKPGDDTTVAAVRVRAPHPACVMAGPPVNRERDGEVVARLMACDGLKIVCGGTTAQIVSRLTGRALEANFEYPNPEVPPTKRLRGVDLVTEGTLTLRRALEYAQGYVEKGSDFSDREDGASRLARALLGQCTQVRFLIGRATDPACQDPGAKLRLVEKLAECVRGTGKEVEVEYY